MYSIKNKPEDFVVIEKNKQLEKEYKQNKNNFSKKYMVFKLKKENTDHITAINQISKFFKIKSNEIGIAGIKDKKAITEQYISIPNYQRIKEQIKNRSIEIKKGIVLEPLFSRNENIFKGFLDGNKFKIFVKTKSKPKTKEFFLNYFGEQRFSKSNVKLGIYLIKRDYEKFVKHFQKDFKGKNYVDWIKKNVDNKILILYIHAYQSYIWNKAVEKIFSQKTELKKYKKIQIPLLGFEPQETNMTQEMIEEYNKIIRKEKISPRDFIFSDLQSASSSGNKREAIAKVTNLKITKKTDGFLIEFFLPKGSYATEFIKQIMEK